MAAGYFTATSDTSNTGKKIDTFELTVSSNTVQRQVVVVGDPSTAAGYAAVPTAGADALSNSTCGIVSHMLPCAFNGTTWDRLRTVGTGGSTNIGVLKADRPSDSWAIVHTPAANTQATITQAAGASGVRHVCTSITAVLAAGTSAPSAAQVKVRLRDGGTGAGTILWDATMCIQATAGVTNIINLGGLRILGTAATAMTLEFDGSAGANTFESVSVTGYSISA